MNKKLLLFDFGGTLDTNGIHWSVYFWDLYGKFKLSIPYDDYREAFLEADRMLSSSKRSDMNYKETLKEQMKLQFEYLKNHMVDSQSVTGSLIDKMSEYCYSCVNGTISFTREILATLHSDFKLGLLSNFYGNLAVVLKELDLSRLFDVVIDSAIIGFAKPDERVFIAAIKESKIDSEFAVMIGDSYDKDIVPAKTLGLTTVWLDGRSWTRPDDTLRADFTIHSIKELPLLISKHFL